MIQHLTISTRQRMVGATDEKPLTEFERYFYVNILVGRLLYIPMLYNIMVLVDQKISNVES